MYCKHCGGPLANNSSFCNRCGRPIVDNSADENKKKGIVGAILAIIAAIFATVAIIVSIIGLPSGDTPPSGTNNSGTTTTAPEKQTIKVSAKDLYQAYEENEVAADRKYGNQLVEITGTVDNIGTDVIGRVYITFPTGKTLKSVQCYFEDDEAIDGVASIAKGQTVTVVGTCGGFTLNVSVKDCIITDFAPADSDTQTSSTPSDGQE